MNERAEPIAPPTGDSSAERPIGALLGPQRLGITIGRELATQGISGNVAAITAGWQERESEAEELDEAIGRRSINLMLHARCEELFAADEELFQAHRDKQDHLRKLQEFHRVRLEHAVASTRELLGLAETDARASDEVDAAFEYLRALDAHHAARLDEVQDDFEAQIHLRERSEVARHREEIGAAIAECDAVAIAGGHVASLLNRLRLFGVRDFLCDKPVFAWSAGAMVVTERVVVFHDRPPQGRGNAEVVSSGLGLFRGVTVFPHAKRRLSLEEPRRVMLLARRFAPGHCITLDEWSGLRYRGDDAPEAFGPTTRLEADGRVVSLAEPLEES